MICWICLASGMCRGSQQLFVHLWDMFHRLEQISFQIFVPTLHMHGTTNGPRMIHNIRYGILRVADACGGESVVYLRAVRLLCVCMHTIQASS